MRLQRILLIGAVLVIIAAMLLSGTARKILPGKDEIQLSIGGWSAGDAEKNMITKQIGLFEKSHPGIKVRFEVVTGIDYNVYMQSNIAAGTEQDIFYAPDVFVYHKKGLLLPIDKYLPPEKLKDYYPEMIKAFTMEDDGHIYALPKDVGVIVLFYNMEMFKAAGINGPPDNWDDLLADCRKLEEAGKKGLLGKDFRKPLCLESAYFGTLLFPFIYQNGGDIYDRTTNKLVFNQPAAAGAFEFYFQKLLRENHYADQANNLGAPDTATAFAQKKAAMVFNGSWMNLSMQNLTPGWKYGTAMMPKNKVRASSMAFGAYVMGKNCKHPREAAELISFLTGPEAGKVVAESGLGLPASPSLSDWYKKNYPQNIGLIDSIPYCEIKPLGKKGGMVCDEFNRIYGYLISDPNRTVMQEINRAYEALKLADKHDHDYNWN